VHLAVQHCDLAGRQAVGALEAHEGTWLRGYPDADGVSWAMRSCTLLCSIAIWQAGKQWEHLKLVKVRG